ncbi:MAG: type II secretion system protein [Reinekea sp.]|nr:type II secretion system protein [Reinekea sp.]
MDKNGFTIIELIVVIVLLSVLAAFALPRFADLSGRAQISVVQQMEASLTTAVHIAVMKYKVEGGAGSTLNFNGNNINFIAGLPQPDASQLRFLLDSNFPSTIFTNNWSTVPCSGSDFCVVGNLAFNEPTLPVIPDFISGSGIFIWPEGYVLSDCVAYYLNLRNGSGPVTGSILSGC